MTEFYMVVGYNSIECMNAPARVYMYGIYSTKEEAIQRQICLSGKDLDTPLVETQCMYGINGMISWVRKVSLGDINPGIDIRQIRDHS